jgi:hypothetical protein
MDSLALLCNLHGDGPATLARLRELGCFELAAVRSVNRDALSALFQGNEKFAARFEREARVLSERLGESEEGPAPSVSKGGALTQPCTVEDYSLAPEMDEFAPSVEPAATKMLTPFPGLSRVGAASAALLGVVPLANTNHQESESPQDSAGPHGVVINAVLELWSRLDGHQPPAQFTATCKLREAQIEGFSSEAAEKLCAAGLQTLEDLVEAELLDLVGSSGLPYTKLAHLQFLARKVLGAGHSMKTPAPAARPESQRQASLRQEKGLELTPFWSRVAKPAVKEVVKEETRLPDPVEEGPAGPFA